MSSNELDEGAFGIGQNPRLYDQSECWDYELDPSEMIDGVRIFPATVIVDTREQTPFHFLNIDPWPIVPVSHATLKTGDYSMRGYESRLTIERKSIGDFLGSISADRDRFEREFERMAEMEFAAVVIEGELSEVLQHARDNTNMKTKSIMGTLDSWRIRYGVHWVFGMGRRGAERNTLTLLYHFWKIQQEDFKALKAR